MTRTKSRRTLHDLGVSAQYQRDASVASAVHSTHGFAEERIDHRAENHREHAVVVREAVRSMIGADLQAVESINKIVEDMSPEVVRDEMVVVIEELFHDEWFTPRVSSVSLIARAYSKIASLPASDAESPLKTLRDDFFALCKDDTPMVRRAAAKAPASETIAASAPMSLRR